MNYRNPQLLRLAKGMPCMLQVPSVCCGDPETTVAAHSNLMRHGKGTSEKAGDEYHCWACAACHRWLDHGPAPRSEKEAAFLAAFERTYTALWARGLINVKGARTPKEAVYQPSSKIMPRRHAA